MLAKYTFPGPDPSVKTEWHTTASGVRLKSYIPPTYKPNQPLVYFIHGGGFVIGSVDQDDRFVNIHSKDTGCVFVSVEYRLAPQHKHPAAFQDCVDGARWCVEHAEKLGARRGPIVIMGKSAGGSLAFAVALKMIDDGQRDNVLAVVPCQPLTIHPRAVPEHMRSRFLSYDENAENTVNTKEIMLAFYGEFWKDCSLIHSNLHLMCQTCTTLPSTIHTSGHSYIPTSRRFQRCI